MLIKMAWRNLFRRPRRTFVTAFTVAFGMLLSFFFTSIGDYSYTNIIDTSAKMGYGHITVEPAGYHDRPSQRKRLPDAAAVLERATAIDGIDGGTIRILGQGMFATARKSIGGMLIGVDPALEDDDVNLFLSKITAGAVFPDADGREVVIGQKMAEKLKLKIGKKMIWTTTDATGEIVSQIAYVGGVFSTGVDEVDSAFVLLPLERVRKTLGYAEGEATMVSLFVADQRKTDRLAALVREVAPDAETLTWRKTQADIAGFVAIDSASNYLFQLLVGLLIAAGILNTILMNVLERTHEFGVMLAIGTPPRRLFAMVLTESLILGAVGVIMGIGLCVPTYWYMVDIGIDFTAMMPEDYDLGGVLIDPVMKSRFYIESALAIVASVFALTALAGIYPAIRAAGLPPVESIKAL